MNVTGDLAMGMLLGFLAGTATMFFAIKNILNQISNNSKENKEVDPANWWKNGGTPYDEY